MKAVFKFKVEGDYYSPDPDDAITGIAYSNRRIPRSLFSALNNACHEEIDKVNGKFAWRKTYIRFSRDGKTWEQFDGKNEFTPCNECCFLQNGECTHPYKYNGRKGYCGNPYREVNNVNLDKVISVLRQTGYFDNDEGFSEEAMIEQFKQCVQ